MQVAQARLKEALAGTNTSKEKGYQVADGILSLTPDTPDVIERRKKGRGVDCVETTSKYLEESDSGMHWSIFADMNQNMNLDLVLRDDYVVPQVLGATRRWCR